MGLIGPCGEVGCPKDDMDLKAWLYLLEFDEEQTPKHTAHTEVPRNKFKNVRISL